jgi:hypothetical protein
MSPALPRKYVYVPDVPAVQDVRVPMFGIDDDGAFNLTERAPRAGVGGGSLQPKEKSGVAARTSIVSRTVIRGSRFRGGRIVTHALL